MSCAPVDDGPSRDEAMLLTWLERHDECCPVCRYRLQGIESARCPECGTDLRLTVDSSEARQGAWLFAMLAPALGMGFTSVVAAILLVAVTLERIQQGSAAIPWQPVVIFSTMLLLALIDLAVLMYLLSHRSNFMKRPVKARWKLASAWFIGVGLMHLAAGITLAVVL